MGVQALVYFIEAVRHALNTSTLGAPPPRFGWISLKTNEIQPNRHGGALNVEVFKAWREVEHPYFNTELLVWLILRGPPIK